MTGQNSHLSIRKATLHDIDVVQVIAYATWPNTYSSILTPGAMNYMLQHFYSKDALLQQMENGHDFYIIEMNAVAVGFASINEVGPGIYKLQKLYVLPPYQKTGAGKTLMHYTIQKVKEAGAKEFILNVNRNNPAAEFYKKQGFQIIKHEDVDIGSGYLQEDYVMALQLS